MVNNPVQCNVVMLPAASSPEVADQLLEIMGPAAERTLARGANLNMKFESKIIPVTKILP